MKIAFVSQEYPPETARGGIGSQTFAKAKGLSALGHTVFVISRSVDENRYETRDGNITVIRIPGLEAMLPVMMPAVEWLSHSLVVAAEVERLHENVHLDLVDFPEWGAEAYTFLLNRNKWNKVPTVIQLHGPLVMLAHTISWPETDSDFYRIGTQIEGECIRRADAVYSSSRCSANWVQAHYDRRRKDIPVIHLGIDTNLFTPQPVPKNERLTIIFSGKIVPNKGVNELAEAAIALRAQFPHLLVRFLGRGDKQFTEQLLKKAQRAGIDDLFEFVGFVGAEQLPTELSKAHLFAAPSYYEGGPGFVYLEAMACGLPVVGCSGSGVEEIVDQGKNGLLVPPGDSCALSKALQIIIADQGLMQTMGDYARNYVLEKSERAKCLQKLENFYQTIVKKADTGKVNETILSV